MQAMPLRDHVSGLLIPKERKYCIKAVIVKHNDDGTVLYTPLAFGEEQIKGLDKATYDDKNDVYYMYVRSKFSQAGAALNALYFRHIASWVTAAFALLFILSVLAQSIRFSKQERLRQKEKSDLLISVAHELKTPMGTTSLYAEKIDRSESLEQAQQATLSLQREVLLMRDRLSDLLTFSKIDGKAVLRKTSFDLGDLLEDVSDEYVPQMEDKGIAFNIASHPEINVCADRTRIRMALSN